MKIRRHQTEDGFIYYEAIAKGVQLLAFRVTDLVYQLWSIYKIDLRMHLFNVQKN